MTQSSHDLRHFSKQSRQLAHSRLRIQEDEDEEGLGRKEEARTLRDPQLIY